VRVFVSGGAGFIGCNVAARHLERGDEVVVYDNLSRVGTELNLKWLTSTYRSRLQVAQRDVRDQAAVLQAMPANTDVVYHFAAQVAVTTSIADPTTDFDINARGTLNVLDATRRKSPGAVFFYSSTNKVYGGMTDLAVEETATRWRYRDLPSGVSEERSIDFHTPYGCSKGCGDQYTLDFARVYGMKTVVFRQSCIYGTHQFGIEDQGWVAYLCLAALEGRPIKVYGDGKQVRDVLWMDDLIDAFDSARAHIDQAAGQAFNIGGGSEHTISVWHEFAPHLERLSGKKIEASFHPWRAADQKVFVCDVGKAERLLGWKPKTGFREGIDRLWAWLVDARNQA